MRAIITFVSDEPLTLHAGGDVIFSDAHRLEVELPPGALRVMG